MADPRQVGLALASGTNHGDRGSCETTAASLTPSATLTTSAGKATAITGGVDRLLTVPKVEMTGGKLFNSEPDRLHVLALLLESVGIDAAVRLGPPELWRQAVSELPNA